MKRATFVLALVLVCTPTVAIDVVPEVSKPLPAWSRGTLDIHQISTGRGNAAFFVFPDGTTMIVDAGAVGDGTKIADTDPRPDASRTTGGWIARYIERAMAPAAAHLDYALLTHFHPDHMGQLVPASAPSKSGAFKLTGITEVGEKIPIDTIIDRGTSYMPPQDDAMMKNYHAFLADQQQSRGTKAETIRVGSADQIVLRHDPAAFPSFEVRNVAADGMVWTGEGDGARPIFPPLQSIAAVEDRPSENMCSIGLRIRYGKFSYFTGGDMSGVPDAGAPAWHSVETAVAGAIGPADVHVVNHHGSISPESAVFLSTLKSPVMILPAWSVTHPSQDSLKRMLTMRLYPGAHDVFVTTLREPAKASIGARVDQLKAQHGHIVVRVAPGGDQYRVFVLDDTTDDAEVVAVFGPYASHVQKDTQTAAVKTPIKGLVSMGAYKFVSHGGEPVNTLDPLRARPEIFGGIVIVATWNELQPNITDITNYTAIDEALKAVRAYNQKYRATPLAVKLRVWGGFEAPEWAKRLDGGPITVMFAEKQRTIGHVWSPAYRKAWRDFQNLLAKRYDDEALIHEVSVTSCMLLTAEPFVVPTDKETLPKLHEAGFSDAKFRSCLAEAVADYDDWKSTRIEFPFNPFRLTDDPTNISLDYKFTFKVMRECREHVGERCTLDNHDLVVPPLTTIVPLYAEMQKLGGEIEFQTFNETPQFYGPTIAYGAGLGASSIELWQDFQGFPCVPVAQLKNWASFFGSQQKAKNGEPACVVIPK